MENLEARVSGLEKALETLVKEVQDIKSILTSSFEKVDGNFEKVHQKIDSLRGESGSDLGTVETTMKIEFADLKEELKKIADTYPYEGLSENLKIVNRN